MEEREQQGSSKKSKRSNEMEIRRRGLVVMICVKTKNNSRCKRYNILP